ncbi:MAG: T9SS type A sorting domain-containing protein [Putridiphycobacter sp.]|nr:T9SS type A sorting domain-containing protein [Putridiphycobacter sp.]
MKLNLRFFMMSALIATSGVSFAQSAETSPTNGTFVPSDDRAQFDILQSFNVGSTGSIGANGMAGVAFINGQYIVSAWASDSLFLLNADGSLNTRFVIPGITGTRSITYDGTHAYFGTASTAIYQVDPSNWSLNNIISISTTSSATARMCTYDATLDGGNGGFWIGNFGNDIASVSMTGAELSVIPAATHGLTVYGGAFDNYSPDGPWLWVFDQTGTAPNQCNIVQVNPTTGVPTGVSYNYTPNAIPGTTGSLAGGLFISNEYAVGKNVFVGLGQSSPSNDVFIAELTASTAAVETANSLELSIYPNPASDVIRLSNGVNAPFNVELLDISGKIIMSKVVDNGQLDVSALTSGIYLVKVSQKGMSTTQKLVIK